MTMPAVSFMNVYQWSSSIELFIATHDDTQLPIWENLVEEVEEC